MERKHGTIMCLLLRYCHLCDYPCRDSKQIDPNYYRHPMTTLLKRDMSRIVLMTLIECSYPLDQIWKQSGLKCTKEDLKCSYHWPFRASSLNNLDDVHRPATAQTQNQLCLLFHFALMDIFATVNFICRVYVYYCIDMIRLLCMFSVLIVERHPSKNFFPSHVTVKLWTEMNNRCIGLWAGQDSVSWFTCRGLGRGSPGLTKMSLGIADEARSTFKNVQ